MRATATVKARVSQGGAPVNCFAAGAAGPSRGRRFQWQGAVSVSTYDLVRLPAMSSEPLQADRWAQARASMQPLFDAPLANVQIHADDRAARAVAAYRARALAIGDDTTSMGTPTVRATNRDVVCARSTNSLVPAQRAAVGGGVHGPPRHAARRRPRSPPIEPPSWRSRADPSGILHSPRSPVKRRNCSQSIEPR